MATAGSAERNALTILWRIENLSSLEIIDGWERVTSPEWKPRTFGEKRCLLYFDKIQSENDECTSLALYLCESNHLGFSIDCEWSFVGSDGSNLFVGYVRNLVLQPNTPFHMPDCSIPEEVFGTRKSEILPNDTLTVRFRIWKSNGDLSKDELISCRTRADTSECSILWPIARFSSIFPSQSHSVETPVLIDSFEMENKFTLRLYVTGKTFEDAIIHVDLAKKSIFQDLLIQLEISILDREQKTFKCKKRNLNFFGNNITNLMVSNIVSRKELMQKKSDCLRNDVLTLLCEISAVCFTRDIEKCYRCEKSRLGSSKILLDASCQTSVQNANSTDIYVEEKSFLSFLAEDFLNMYKDQDYTDFELRSGDVSFPVHKNVLSARSPVFKAMFSRHMKESGSDSTDIPDLDSHTLNRMLTSMYSGTVEQDLEWESAVKLYYAADKYQVASLKEQCSSVLRFYVSVSNVSDLLTLADRHQDKDLTTFVLDFVVSHFDEVMQSREWESFMDSDSALPGKVMHMLYKKKMQSKLASKTQL